MHGRCGETEIRIGGKEFVILREYGVLAILE